MIPKFIKTYDNIIFFAFNKVNDKYVCIPKMIDDYNTYLSNFNEESNNLEEAYIYFLMNNGLYFICLQYLIVNKL